MTTRRSRAGAAAAAAAIGLLACAALPALPAPPATDPGGPAERALPPHALWSHHQDDVLPFALPSRAANPADGLSLGEPRDGSPPESGSGAAADAPLAVMIPPTAGTPTPGALALPDEAGAAEFDPADGPLIQRTTGRLAITYPGDRHGSCTGTVISSDTGDIVLTAAHCLYDPVHRVMAARVQFAPAERGAGAIAPFGVWEAADWVVPQQFVDTASQRDGRSYGEGWAFDFAWIRLHDDDAGRAVQDYTGGQGVSFTQEFSGAAFVGYPVEDPFDGTVQRLCAQSALGFGDMHWPHLTMDCSVTSGVSGAAWLTAVDAASGAGYAGAVFSTLLPGRVSGAMLGTLAHDLLLELQEA